MKRGLFVVIEGLDRCGKSTQCDLLVQQLSAVSLNFPDRTTEIGKSINEYLKNKSELNDHSIHLLFSANRWEKEKFIRETLNSGKHIVCGRYAYSGVAYTHAKGTMDLEYCMNPDVGLPKPDLVVFLQIDLVVASKRSQYGEEKYEKIEFQKHVLESFEQVLSTCDNVKYIDATLSPKDIHSIILKECNELIKMDLFISNLWK
jgi:dTMP kinase